MRVLKFHWNKLLNFEVEFCEAVHPLLTDLYSEVKIGFSRATLAADIQTLYTDVNTASSAEVQIPNHHR